MGNGFWWGKPTQSQTITKALAPIPAQLRATVALPVARQRSRPLQLETLEDRLALDGSGFPGEPVVRISSSGARVFFGDHAPEPPPPPLPTTGTLTGRVWYDTNLNQEIDLPAEGFLYHWLVFLDQDQDYVWDQGELFTFTDRDGAYQFDEVPAGDVTLVQYYPAGWYQSFPRTELAHKVQLQGGTTVLELDFGNIRQVTAPTSVGLLPYPLEPPPGEPDAPIIWWLPQMVRLPQSVPSPLPPGLDGPFPILPWEIGAEPNPTDHPVIIVAPGVIVIVPSENEPGEGAEDPETPSPGDSGSFVPTEAKQSEATTETPSHRDGGSGSAESLDEWALALEMLQATPAETSPYTLADWQNAFASLIDDVAMPIPTPYSWIAFWTANTKSKS